MFILYPIGGTLCPILQKKKSEQNVVKGLIMSEENHPSLNMYLSSNTFQYFRHFLTKLSDFFVIGHGKWRFTNNV